MRFNDLKCYPLHFKFCRQKSQFCFIVLYHIQKPILLLWKRDHVYITFMIQVDFIVPWTFFCPEVKLGFLIWKKILKIREEIHQN